MLLFFDKQWLKRKCFVIRRDRVAGGKIIFVTHAHTDTRIQKKISLNKVAHLHSRLLPIRIFLNMVPLTAHKRVPDHCS